LRKTITVCDLDPDDESTPAVASLVVAGPDFARQIDVCADHEAWFRRLGQSESSAQGGRARQGSPSGGRGGRPRGRKRSPVRDEPIPAGPVGQRREGSRRALQAERAAVRDWARAQGRAVGDKGRLPLGLIEEYRQQQAG
jgi:hypothetical protein